MKPRITRIIKIKFAQLEEFGAKVIRAIQEKP